MASRKLKRQLNLAQIVMLGTAGAIGAEIFVLTGHAAGMAGPAMVLAIIIGGVLSYSIALNYSELATAYPVTGGALTYVREAWGNNLLSYLVGSLDCLSSTFYAGLSAVGFAYSVKVFFPFLPVIPTAIGIVVLFIVLNILGVGNIGNTQIILGSVLLVILVAYIILGFTLPAGFDWNTFLPDGKFFIYDGFAQNIKALFTTTSLIYVAFIGFEVIADDAEEIKNPSKNIPNGIMISLTLCLILYPLISMVTLGTIPWIELAGSDTALSDASSRFLPGIGPMALAAAGILATITTLNSAMLSATREAFTMSRNGMWPRILSRLGRFRTPSIATLVVGGIICAIAAIGVVDFLSYISASGYLFVLFFSNLALVRLRKRYPNLQRPYKIPLYPVPVFIAMGTCFLIVASTDWRALTFGAGLLAVLSVVYYLSRMGKHYYGRYIKTGDKLKNRILVPVANPKTGAALVHMAAILAQAIEDTSVCVFHVKLAGAGVNSIPHGNGVQTVQENDRFSLPEQIMREARERNVPLYTKVRAGSGISEVILDELETQKNIKLILAGWPGPVDPETAAENPIRNLIEKAQTNIAVFYPHHKGRIQHILIPLGGGPHSRLALRLAYEVAEEENARVIVFREAPENTDDEELEDAALFLQEIVNQELGLMPARITIHTARSGSVTDAVLEETGRQKYDLLVMGASEEYGLGTRLFGSVDDWIIEHVRDCSVLLVRQHESVMIHWIRRYLKKLWKEYQLIPNGNNPSNHLS